MMNEKQVLIYDELCALIKADNKNGKAFYYVDNIVDGVTYRVFSYRLANYSHWLHNDSALQSRGITFEMSDDDEYGHQRPVRLVSWPFEKFFNRNENPMTEKLDFSNPTEILLKEDGSLISTMLLANGKLHLKSKTSLQSPHAIAAMNLLEDTNEEYTELQQWLSDWTNRDYTVIMEYTSPTNRIVVPYNKSALTILAMRNNMDGSYMNLYDDDDDTLSLMTPTIRSHLVRNFVQEVDDVQSFVDNIPKQRNIEGYVIRLASGQRVKIKTDWYRSLHGYNNGRLTPDSIIKAVLYETIDDIRAVNHHSPEMIQLIDDLTAKVSNVYNHVVAAVEGFYEQNKHLDRREYAILGKKVFVSTTDIYFGLAMQLYGGKKPVNFADAIHRHRAKLGLAGEQIQLI